jgi:hypothetical protein
MNKIVFECMDKDGELFTVSMESSSRAVRHLVADQVEAYRKQGIEVISASQVEELAVDLALQSRPVREQGARKGWLARIRPFGGFRPMWVTEKAATFGGLGLAVIGFDNGPTLANMAAHAVRLFPAISRLI